MNLAMTLAIIAIKATLRVTDIAVDGGPEH
jgi:hypothetical protein